MCILATQESLLLVLLLRLRLRLHAAALGTQAGGTKDPGLS